MTDDRSKEQYANQHPLTEDSFRAILDAAPDAVVIIGLDGKVVEWSASAESLFGWKKQEAVGRLLGTLIVPPAQRDAHWNGLERYRETGDSRILEQQLQMTGICRDGREIPVELWISSIQHGAEQLVAGFLRDRTAATPGLQTPSKRSVEARLVQQASTLTVAVESFDAALQKCLELICSVTGWQYARALVPDDAASRLVASEVYYAAESSHLDDFRDACDQLRLNKGEGLAGRVWQSGEILWKGDLRQAPSFRDLEAGNTLDVVGAFAFPVNVDSHTVAVLEFFSAGEIAPDPQLLLLVDSLGTQLGRIIERHQWEEERAHLASIVDSSYDAIIGKDIAGNIISWNAGAEQVYGYSAEEAIGQSIAIILPDDSDGEEEEIEQATKTGQQLTQFETIRRRKDHREIPVAVTVSPIRDSKGRIIGSSTIERDITQRRHREKEFEQARSEAVAARDQAETANRTKSEFLANISHELRTPMNAIIGMLELALGEPLNPVMYDYLKTARDSADTLLFLLDDLLDFSRMEAGKLELEDEPFDIRKVVDGTMKTLSLRAYEKGLELAGHISPRVPLILSGDGNRLRQVITNLTGNAIKFTERGEVVLSITDESQDEKNVELRLAVRDTGIGISKEDQKKIFAPFEQLDASTTREQTGTGLGLAICQELVQKMGGRIWLESEEGSGTTFYCTMRFGVADRDGDQVSDSVPDLSDLRVLVVDDNDSNRTIIADTLQDWSLCPTTIASGRDALHSVVAAEERGEPYPLIIVDALMPDIDGFTLIETLQERGMSEIATVLMLSSADRQAFKDRCEQLAISAFLEKPISQSDMHDAVMTALLDAHPDSVELSPIPEQAKPCRILVAEDTPANQKVVKAILEKRGHSVEVAHNGREAIDRHRQETFDVILMDVQMPTMDGLQATEAIRQLTDPQLAQIPIIAMTAHARREDRLRCLKAGMDAYISKPIDADRLLELIDNTRHRNVATSRPSSGVDEAGDGPGNQQPLQKTSSTDATGMIDREAAIERMGGNADLFADICRFFHEDVPDLMAAIDRGMHEDDPTAVTRAAHSIRGLAANFNAAPVIAAAQSLEDAAAAGETHKLAELASELRRLVDRLSNEIDALSP